MAFGSSIVSVPTSAQSRGNTQCIQDGITRLRTLEASATCRGAGPDSPMAGVYFQQTFMSILASGAVLLQTIALTTRLEHNRPLDSGTGLDTGRHSPKLLALALALPGILHINSTVRHYISHMQS